jgi:ribosome-associated toxin RatA of RatAB toxin-antitoxin module
VRRAFVFFFLGCFLLSGELEARPQFVKSRRASIDPAAVSPLLARGELALVESRSNGRPWQVVTFSIMNAPPADVFEAVSSVEIYPKYLFSVDEAKVLSKRQGMELSEWALNIPIVGLKGRRVMRARSPSLVEFKGVSGHFKNHHERWELLPIAGGRRTLVVMHRSVDLAHNGGLLLKAMIALEPSLEHGIYIAASFVQIQDLRRYVERLPRAKPGHHKGPIPSFTQAFDQASLKSLQALMKLGELSLIESHPDGSLKQTAVMTTVSVNREKVVRVAHDAQRFPEFVPNLVRYDVSKGKDGTMLLDYEIDVPLVNIEGQMSMEIGKDDQVKMTAVAGDIKRGKWLWTFQSLGPNITVPIHYSYTDVRDTSWFVRKLIEIQPLFEHGVVVASSTVQVRAIKERSEGKR